MYKRRIKKILQKLLVVFMTFAVSSGMLELDGMIYNNYTSASAAEECKYPFPQHVTYTKDTLKPGGKQSELDKATSNFYTLWKKKYIVKNPYAKGKTQYYICSSGQSYKTSKQTVTICVSEGQGYGMLITAYMAGYDKDAKKLFDGLYRYYKAHTCTRGSYLMSWQQQDNGKQIVDNSNGSSATDGDLDIAYALLLADKQWGSKGTINYKKAAKNIIDDILTYEVHKDANTIQLGNWSSTLAKDHIQSTGLRSSDLMTGHFKAFASATKDNTWKNIASKSYSIIDQLTVKSSRKTGLLPDFIVKGTTKYKPASSGFLEGNKDGSYGYNACRCPFRLGIDYLTTKEAKLKPELKLLNTWIRKKTGSNVSKIKSGYTLTGKAIENYSDMSYVAPFLVASMCQSNNTKGAQKWVDDLWGEVVKTGLWNYYNDTVKMLCMIVASGNWWTIK